MGGDEVIMSRHHIRVVTFREAMRPGEPVGRLWLRLCMVGGKRWNGEGRVPYLVCILGERDCVCVSVHTHVERCATLQRKLCGFKVL